MNLRRFSL